MIASDTAGLPAGALTDAARERIEIMLALVRKWTASVNLIAPSTVSSMWNRHVVDSAQLFDMRPAGAKAWADLGSGAGFPGMIIAILAADADAGLRVTLVESDSRKAAFLRNVSRETKVPVTVIADRIETRPPLAADVLSARALAPLSTLCSFAARHLDTGGIALFPKGAGWAPEIEAAREKWRFDLDALPSITAPDARILRLRGIAHA